MRRFPLPWVVALALLSAGTDGAPAQGPGGLARKVGFLGANTPEAAGHLTTAFLSRLKQLGWVEGANLTVEYRWAAGRTEKFFELAADLVAQRVDVIVTSGNAPALAARRATATIPIVLASSGDIVRSGLVQSLSRPGGNVTGLTFAPENSVGKRLEFLREAVPGLRRIAVLVNPENDTGELQALRAVAIAAGLTLDVLEFRGPADLDRMAAVPDGREAGALYVISDPLVFTNRRAINAFAARQGLPSVHRLQEYADDGGLISYGAHFPDFFRDAAEFVDRIFRGDRPEHLPIRQPTTYRLVLNLRTARALGLTIPPSLLARADEVIE